MAIKGITKRWILNNLSLIIVILVAIECVLSVLIHDFFYNDVKQTIYNKSATLASIFPNYKENSSINFSNKVKLYINEFEHTDFIEVTAFNSENLPIYSSINMPSNNNFVMPDYQDALGAEDGSGLYTGKNSLNENVMAYTKIIRSNNNNFTGAVRYVVHLNDIDNHILGLIIICIIIGLIILSFVFMSSSYFISSIVNPIHEISKTARKIALGDLNAKIDKVYDDEIGELCDTVNYMAKRLNESERIKNEFISSISHELRTPLTAIKGWAETIELGDKTSFELNKRGIKIIKHEAGRLCGLVEELLDFSRLQCGKMNLSLEQLDILAEISDAVYMFKNQAALENKELIYSEPPILPLVMGDRHKLRQIFINLIDNAIKYTPSEGKITVEVKENLGYIYITISDTGCGIPAVHLPHIRDRFYKANKTQSGSGIGLAVVDELVKMHNGTLKIESEENVGTVVTVAIPMIKNQNDQVTGGLG